MAAFMVSSIEELRSLYPLPKERAVKKQLDRLDEHCMRFIRLSPFLVLASQSNDGSLDASPRGGEPGFVRIWNSKTLLIPDAPGNNRLDTLSNLLSANGIGMLFFIPGVDETLRVNGTALLSRQPELLAGFSTSRQPPKLVIEVRITECFLHCAKSMMRARLWDPSARIPRDSVPTMGRMISDQTGAPLETQEEMLARYAKDL